MTASYLQGVLAAMVEVSKVTGKQKLDGMSEREWKLICEIDIALAELALKADKARTR